MGVEFATSPAGPWTPVTLPHDWAAQGVRRPGYGIYRIHVVGPDEPASPRQLPTLWSMHTERMANHRRIRLNDHWVEDSLAGPGLARLQPAVVPLPMQAWATAGENIVEIEVESGRRAGLGALEFGPTGELERSAARLRYWSADLPQRLNMAAAGACLLGVLLWWRRRSEASMGWFGLLGLVLSLRNQAYFELGSELPGVLASTLFFAVQVFGAWLLGRFTLSQIHDRPRWFMRSFGPVVTLVAVWGLWAGFTGIEALERARAQAYPVLSTVMLACIWLLLRHVFVQGGRQLMPLAAALLGIVVASAHDYFYQQGLTGIGGWWDERWLPYATPLLVLSFLGVMVRRMVSALGEVEVLNQTLELRVLDRTQALVSANDAQARFLAAASHDLRQPMVAIGLLVGLLREQVVDPLQTALVAKVDQAVLALQDLLAGLTDLSRLDAGAVRAQAQAVDLAALFAAIRSHAGEAAARKDLRLELRIDPCPDRQAPGQPPLQVSADPVLLEQLLRNLIDNALRYTRRGGVLVRARALPNQQVRLEVWDSGPGIARADRQRVFEPFVRLREGGAGQGLGLAIVQRSAELMKAPITLRSRPGRGCCFSLTLPAMRPAPPTPPSPPREARWLAGRRILLVEDDAAVRDALVARLEAWGAQVDACKHLAGLSVRLHEAALAGHHAPRWDLMLTDLRLPDGQGYQAAEKLLTQQPGTPILLVTGNTAPAELAALAQSGLPVLHKPFRMEQLQQALVDLLKV